MQALGLIVYQSYHVVENLNNTRYDNLGKPMKQTSFKVKNPRRPILRRTIHYQIEVYSQEYLICSKLNYDYQI